jgi:hypothetical protein
LNIMLQAFADEKQYNKLKTQGFFLDRAKFFDWQRKLTEKEAQKIKRDQKLGKRDSVTIELTSKKDRVLTSDDRKKRVDESNRFIRMNSYRRNHNETTKIEFFKNSHGNPSPFQNAISSFGLQKKFVEKSRFRDRSDESSNSIEFVPKEPVAENKLCERKSV